MLREQGTILEYLSIFLLELHMLIKHLLYANVNFFLLPSPLRETYHHTRKICRTFVSNNQTTPQIGLSEIYLLNSAPLLVITLGFQEFLYQHKYFLCSYVLVLYKCNNLSLSQYWLLIRYPISGTIKVTEIKYP